MFGNTFAKELVENFGIKLDKLVLSTTEDGGLGIEVGKKISKKTTISYINDIVQTIKIKYQNSRRFETDITLSPDTSGIDFLYKNEY
jgi:autotransporter translocation and assembly factor TamB